jgi:hypothetical protein
MSECVVENGMCDEVIELRYFRDWFRIMVREKGRLIYGRGGD